MRDGTYAVPSVREFGTGLRAQIERAREMERQKACRELLWAIEAQELSARLRERAAREAALDEESRDTAETPLRELVAA